MSTAQKADYRPMTERDVNDRDQRSRPLAEQEDVATHVLHALVYGGEDLTDLHPVIECLNNRGDVHRDCKYATDDGHDDCPEWNRYMAWRDDPDAALDPWQSPPRFSCGGWTGPDGNHLHPDDGCGIEWTIRYVGEEVCVTDARLRSGEGFRIHWIEGCPVLTPAPRAVQPDREADR